MVLRGGGIPNLEVIQNEVYKILAGRGRQIRDFLDKLDTFATQLNQQRDDIRQAIDSTDRLLGYAAKRVDTLDRALTEFPPLIEHFNKQRKLFTDTVEAVGRVSNVTDQTFKVRGVTCIRTCRICSGHSSNSAGRRRIWSMR